LRLGLPAKGTEQPITARSVFEGEEGSCSWLKLRIAPTFAATRPLGLRSLVHADMLIQKMRGKAPKKTAPARGNCTEAVLIQIPDGDRGCCPRGLPQHWNNPVRVNTSRAHGKSSKRSVLVRSLKCDSPSHQLVRVPWAFGVLVGHSPSATLSLPAFVSRSPPDNS
jgi:hypothetical protein